MYRKHSQYPGGLKETPYRRLMATRPEKAIELAVKECFSQQIGQTDVQN